MKVELNKVVSVTYRLEANPQGGTKNHIETAGNDQPLVFLFGTGGLIPAFEENLLGKSVGEKFSFSIDAANAYGDVNTDALVELPIDIFKVDGVVDMSLLRTGNMVPMNDHEGNRLDGKVIGINGDSVKMDFNHPLAGHDLHFSGEVIDVRDASPEELQHGHAHNGEHGH